MCRTPNAGRASVPGLVILVVLGITPAAVAQFSPDPYKPWNSEYESYIYPRYPGPDGIYPNQGVLSMPSGARSANRYQNFLDELEGDTNEPGRPYVSPRRSIGVPYTRAFRQYDQTYGRVYTPNREADREYNASRQARDELYSELRATKDPAQRSRLRKEYELYNRQTLRELMSGRRTAKKKPSSSDDDLLTGPAPLELPTRSRMPSFTTPRPSAGTGTGRSSTRDALKSRSRTTAPRLPSPLDTLRRSELLDRSSPATSRSLTTPPPSPSRTP